MRTRLLLLTMVLAMPVLAFSHSAPFSYLDLKIGPGGIDGTLVVHDFDVAHDLGIADPNQLHDDRVAEQHRDVLMRLMASRLSVEADGVRRIPEWRTLETIADRQSLRLTFQMPGERPGVVRAGGELFPYDPVHQTFVNFYEDGDLRQQAIVSRDRQAVAYYAGTTQGTWAVIKTFVPAGIEHILIGPDHVLFVIGLLLLGGSLRRLAAIVTAFTVGHSITLSLAALDIVSPPAQIVEPAIALSIVFVGADNLLVRRSAKAAAPGAETRVSGAGPRDIRPLVAAVFGLVHGFGFAAVLKEFGLPAAALGWSLFSFNLGVEIGQLAIVLVVAGLLDRIRRGNAVLGERLAVAGSIVVVLAGSYWFIERVFLTGGA